MEHHTFIIAVPESKMADANQLFLVLGESPADVNSFREPNFEIVHENEDDPEGETTRDVYCIRSTRVSDDWLTRLYEPLSRPDFAPDADLEAANRAQEALTDGAIGPDVIAVRTGVDVPTALDEFGVEPYSGEDDPDDELE